jgi:hypothetical protein
MLIFIFALSVLLLSPIAQGQRIAVVNQVIASPTFVNLYWDTTWDSDNPTMKVGTIDAITQAVVESSYFAGLSEYGVSSASFAGGFLPDPSCPAKPPNDVAFYNFFPPAPSIVRFIQCEHDHGAAVLRQNNVIYNVILPPSTMESDLVPIHFCAGPGTPISWHYHGVPPFSGAPIYTIVITNSACCPKVGLCGISGLFDDLTHEMVEATTDPYPVDVSIIPPHISIATQNEIGDFCEGNDLQIFVDGSGTTPLITPIRVQNYWSNAQQTCASFGDSTQPTVNKVAVTNWGSQTTFTISGSGFGIMPPQISLPNTTLPYVEVQNTTQNWEAGNTINGDSIQLNISSWSATQINNVGFGPGTTINNVPAVPLSVSLCNPNSLKCNSLGTASAPGPYNPRLTVFNIVGGEFEPPDTISVLLNATQQVMKNTVGGRCTPCTFSSLQTLSPGTYSCTQIVSGDTPIKRISNGCQQLTLALGEETQCIISDEGPTVPTCPVGMKYCGTNAKGEPICVPQKAECP